MESVCFQSSECGLLYIFQGTSILYEELQESVYKFSADRDVEENNY